MFDYFRNAYPIEYEEIMREIRMGTLNREQILSHAMQYSNFHPLGYTRECNCIACRLHSNPGPGNS
ncbi:hypothetical protein [Pseudosulfitobacter pseudonitzschiae]|uniref:hypothetical protein n=1 Tax=Pseudosulfitobacter pseudonitzschiae TaxID=1402135 RepID=UPI003B806A2B